jgi:hypothetical protein
MSRWLPRHLVLALATLLLLAPRAVASERAEPGAPPNVEVVGRFGGAIRAIAVRGGFAYVGQGRQLAILDISDPSRPRRIGLAGGHGDEVTRIEVAGDYAYVTVESDIGLSNAGVRVIRIADPANPVEVGFYPTLDNNSPVVEMIGSYGYVADNRPRTNVVDFSDPASPKTLGTLDLSLYRLVIVGQHGYTLRDKEIGIFDLSDPAHPTQVGSLPRTSEIKKHAVDGTRLYLLSENYVMDTLDLTDPIHPRAVGQAHLDNLKPWSMVVANGRAWMAVYYSQSMVRLDLADPSHPTILGSTDQNIRMPQVVRGGYAYAIAPGGGLQILTVADDAALAEVSIYQSPGHGTGLLSVALAGPYAYVADAANGVWAYRVDDPVHPVVVGHYEEEGASAERVVARGRYVYLLMRAHAGLDDRLVVLDVEDPTLPKRVAAVEPPDLRVNDLVLDGSYAYVSTSASLRVIDVSDPTDPHEVGSFEVPLEESREYGPVTDRQSRLAVSGQYAYLATMTEKRRYGTNEPYPIQASSGLTVIDLSDPANPVEAGHFRDAWRPRAVGVVGGLVYVVAYRPDAPAKGDLHVFDVSNPAEPTPIDTVYVGAGGFSQTVISVGRYVFVGGGALHVLDASDPARPVNVLESGPSFNGLAVDGDLVYLGAGDEGLMILRFTGAEGEPARTPGSP